MCGSYGGNRTEYIVSLELCYDTSKLTSSVACNVKMRTDGCSPGLLCVFFKLNVESDSISSMRSLI